MHTTISDNSSGTSALAAMTPEREWQHRVQALFRTTVSHMPACCTGRWTALHHCNVPPAHALAVELARWEKGQVSGVIKAARCGNCTPEMTVHSANLQVGAVQKYSSPDPVAGFLHRASLDLNLDASTKFTHVRVPACCWLK
jgi:hypothetical protein